MEWIVQNLSRLYQTRQETIHALRGLQFTLPHNCICLIQGPSGSGKTTLLKILGLLDNEYQGTVWLNRRRIQDWTAAEIRALKNRSLGYIFQEYALMEDTTVFENVRIPLDIASVPWREQRTRVLEILNILDLQSRADASVQALSGGQRQRVAIARAIVNHPAVLLADEAWSSLDPARATSILSWIQQQPWCENLILVTHTALPFQPQKPVYTLTLDAGQQVLSPKRIPLF